MLMKKTLILTAALTALSAAAWAKTPPPAPAHHGILGHLFHHSPPAGGAPVHHGLFPIHPGMAHPHVPIAPSSGGAVVGGVIGNKHSHVYHLPGDKSLPAPQNRVYFPNAAAAMRAGYHAAGSVHAAHSTRIHAKHH